MTARVRSVAHAFGILRLLASNGSQTLTDVARALDLSPSSCLNLLRTLVDEGAVELEPRRKTYRLAPDWFSAEIFSTGKAQSLIDRIKPVIAQFARESQTTVGLWQVMPGRRVQLVAHAECESILRIQLGEGQRQPLGGGAVGRALSAAQSVDDGELARRFAEVKWPQAMRVRQYIDEVHKAQQLGYAVDDGIAFAGVCSVAVAMPNLHPGFCISASLFSRSRSDEDVARIGLALRDLKMALSSQHGGPATNPMEVAL